MPVLTREKLLDAATRLVYARGIAASGVNSIVAESGVSKPTLYSHFESKSDLIAAALHRLHRQRRASLEAYLAERADLPPVQRLLCVFDWVAAMQRHDWARGCPFVNASVEADAAACERIHHHKTWLREALAALAAEAGSSDPARVASELNLLMEGANARMLVEGDHGAIDDARRAAAVLLSL